jgi:hypothetical protein
MYNPISIAPLTESQISKALKGLPVRVSSGNQHDIEISKEQLKKFAKAQKLGKAMNLTFDPFQIQKHMKLIGSGVSRTKKYNNWVDTLGARQVIDAGMSKGASSIRGSGINRDLFALAASKEGRKLANRGPSLGSPEVEDSEYNGPLYLGLGVSRTKKYNKWVDTLGARDLIDAGMSRGASTISGFGLKKRGRPRKTGGALYVAGKN